jgi:hypothetical protein
MPAMKGFKRTPKLKPYLCVRRGSEVKRVLRREASVLIDQGWSYCPRKVWKEQVRDLNAKVVSNKSKDSSKNSKKKSRRKTNKKND